MTNDVEHFHVLIGLSYISSEVFKSFVYFFKNGVVFFIIQL